MNTLHPKVLASTLGAAVSILVVGILTHLGVNFSLEETGAVTTIVSFFFGYLKTS